MKKSYLTGTDQFCGAGGSTTGAKAAGIEMKLALNHWKLAIETHNTNHPETDHDCTDIQACDPRKYVSTDFLFTSPECTNHSLAKGIKRKYQNQLKLFGKVTIKPEEERSRATMWDVPRFAECHDYNFIVVENVVDAKYWTLFDAWLNAMHVLGYNHKSCFFNSMFFGECPQSRDRMYIVFWKKGNPEPDLNFRPKAPCKKCGIKESYQSWKRSDKKWGKYGKNGQYIYRCSKCNEPVIPFYHAALNCIDFSVPITRIGDRKRPLSKNTIKRIEHGLEKYKGQELVITTRYSSGINCRVNNARSEHFPTQPADGSHSICLTPRMFSEGYGGVISDSFSFMNTQTTIQDKNLLMPPFIAELYGNSKTADIKKAIGTITAGGVNHALVLANYSPGYAKSVSEALPTVTANDANGILTTDALNSFLTYYYGSGIQTSNMSDAISTVTTVERAGITIPDVKLEDCYYRTIKSHEIQRAMSFPDEYVILGNSKQRIKQLGNAVTPPVTEWITNRLIDTLK